MVNWKYLAGFAGFAVVISILTGLFSGVSAFDVFVRALVWGLLFAGIGAGVSYVLSTYLAGLITLPVTERPAEQAEGDGEIDFIIPEENPHETARDYQGNGHIEDLSAADKSDDYDTDSAGTESISEDSDVDTIESLDAKREETDDENSDEGESPSYIESDEGEESSLEEIPDIDALDGNFGKLDSTSESLTESGDSEESDAGTASRYSKRGGKENMNIAGISSDPSQAAKALKTWMKRDMEG